MALLGNFGNKTVGELDAFAAKLAQLEAALARENEKLTNTKAALAEAERAFDGELVNASIAGEAAAPKIGEHVAASQRAVEQQEKRTSALRVQLWRTAGDVARKALTSQPELDREREAAIATFTAEWRSAAESWALALGRRVQVERLAGKLQLATPAADEGVDVGDLLPASVRLDALHRGALVRVFGIEAPPPPDEGATASPEQAAHADFMREMARLERAEDSAARKRYA